MTAKEIISVCIAAEHRTGPSYHELTALNQLIPNIL
jgi:hypothetical protein